jgi:glycosyltransferase involved in cell wall biosynthesis
MLLEQGREIEITIVGEGRHRAFLENMATRLGIDKRVRFTGRVPAGDGVVRELDRADLFVLPSRTEGLPKAMIEAMARGLPCLGTSVGGIPELLDPDERVNPENARELAERIVGVIDDPARLTRLSVRNLEVAKEYRSDVLEARRNEFYRYVREHTEEWLRSHGPR